MPEQVKEYLDHKEWTYRDSADNFSVQICPFCADERYHFNIHKTLGLWRCVKCDASGNLFTLKKTLGDIEPPQRVFEIAVEASLVAVDKVTRFCRNLTPGSGGWQYLVSRGLEPRTIQHFRLGCDATANGNWLTIPYLMNGDCQDIKYRTLPPLPKGFRKESGTNPGLFNEEAIKGKTEVLLVEGELDCISLWQMGYDNVVSVPLGAGTFKPEHWDALADKLKVFVIFDPDMVGKRGANKLAQRLDPARCYQVILPGVKDANEFLLNGGTREQLDYILESAKPFGTPTTYSAQEALAELSVNLAESGEVVEGPTFPWQGVQDLFGVMGYGEMTVILGTSGVGKTSYALQLLTHVAKSCQIPALMFCLEMPLLRLMQLLVSQTTFCDRKELNPERVAEAVAALYGVPLYFAKRPRELTWELISEVLMLSIKRYGVKVWVFDNLHFMIRSTNMVQEIGIASQRLKMLAEETGTHGIVVCHPRKPKEGGIPDQYDAAWSQAISADADSMQVVFRQLQFGSKKVTDADYVSSKATYEDRVIIQAAKTRYGGGGRTVLWLHGPSGTFLEDPQTTARQETESTPAKEPLAVVAEAGISLSPSPPLENTVPLPAAPEVSPFGQ